MPTYPERIQYLLQAYSDKTASAIEEQELFDWVTKDETGAQVVAHIRQLLDMPHTGEETAGVDWERLFHKILEQRNGAAVMIRPIPLQKRLVRYAAVAALLLVLLTGAWLWLGQRSVESSSKITAKQGVVAGSNKATLILSDGRTVILDSNTKGAIADSSAGISLANGEISYKPLISSVRSSSYNTLTVPRGSQYKVILPDGSHVWLNAESSLRFPVAFSGKSREVALTGEGYFEIKQNSLQPFVVNTGAVKVRVLGTGFNVMAYKDENAVVVALVNGSVQVMADTTVLLQPGEQVAFLNGQKKVLVTPAGLTTVLAWKSGEFRFDGLNIEGIMRQMVRWYDVNIAYQGALPANEFYGVFPRKGTAQQILDALELTGNVHFKKERNKLLVIPGPKN
jgi:ferric-dicitrate binding protein FerR (iron transport regulator)